MVGTFEQRAETKDFSTDSERGLGTKRVQNEVLIEEAGCNGLVSKKTKNKKKKRKRRKKKKKTKKKKKPKKKKKKKKQHNGTHKNKRTLKHHQYT